MWTRGAQCLLVVSLLAWSGRAWAQTKMTIATGVDPVFSAYYVAQQEGLFKKHGLDVRINTGRPARRWCPSSSTARSNRPSAPRSPASATTTWIPTWWSWPRPRAWCGGSPWWAASLTAAARMETLARALSACPEASPAPTVSLITPSLGPSAGGTAHHAAHRARGSRPDRFFSEERLATAVTVVDATTITATTAARPAGVVDVVVRNSDSQTGTLSSGFTYEALAPPVITSIAPGDGSTTGGTAVTITGTGFVAGATVAFGGIAATGVSVADATSITATTPAHAAGAVDVVVTNVDLQASRCRPASHTSRRLRRCWGSALPGLRWALRRNARDSVGDRFPARSDGDVAGARRPRSWSSTRRRSPRRRRLMRSGPSTSSSRIRTGSPRPWRPRSPISVTRSFKATTSRSESTLAAPSEPSMPLRLGITRSVAPGSGGSSTSGETAGRRERRPNPVTSRFRVIPKRVSS